MVFHRPETQCADDQRMEAFFSPKDGYCAIFQISQQLSSMYEACSVMMSSLISTHEVMEG